MIRNLIIMAIVILSLSSCYGDWVVYNESYPVTTVTTSTVVTIRPLWEYKYPRVRYRVPLSPPDRQRRYGRGRVMRGGRR